jgi:hypothetical protein
MFAIPSPENCPDCGAALSVKDAADHICDEEQRVEHQLVELRPEIERFDGDLADWLESPDGRFARWLAEHDRP